MIARDTYSITSSARASNVGGTSEAERLAVLRLTTSSYLVGVSHHLSRKLQALGHDAC